MIEKITSQTPKNQMSCLRSKAGVILKAAEPFMIWHDDHIGLIGLSLIDDTHVSHQSQRKNDQTTEINHHWIIASLNILSSETSPTDFTTWE